VATAIGVVNACGEEDGGRFLALGDENDRVEVYAVAHEDIAIAGCRSQSAATLTRREIRGKIVVFPSLCATVTEPK